MIEALVALLIFAFGMVGIAGLMGAGVKYQVGNEARLNVAAAIDDLSERIRANATGSKGFPANIGGVTTIGTGYALAQTYASQTGTAPAAPSPDCDVVDCTPAQLAAYDQLEWRTLLRGSLPGGAGYIEGDITTGFTVSVMWFDKNAVDASDALVTAATCTNVVADQGKASARFCCPAGASAPAGVRCYTARVIP